MNATFRSHFASLLVLALGASFLNAAPRDELLRLVPDDMSFCAVLQNLREKSRGENTLMSTLTELPFVKARLDSPEAKKFRGIQQQVLKDLQVTFDQVRDDLLGDAAVFAYRQGPVDRPGQEQALFLVWARDKELLAGVIDRVNAMQTKTGEIKELRALTHNGQAYTQRVKANNPGASDYYSVRDNLLVFALNESVLQAVVDRASIPRALVNERPFWTMTLAQLGFDKAVFAVLINPRSFDQGLTTQEAVAHGIEKSVLTEFQRYWRACDGLGFYADVGEHLEVGLAIHVNKSTLPKAAQQFFDEAGKPSALWKAIPDDALFALAARTDVAALIDLSAGFCDEQRRKEIHQSITGSLSPFLTDRAKFDDLAKGLGPDWGIWASRPASTDKDWAPQAVLAVKVQDSPEGAAAEKTVRNAVQFLATIAQFSSKDGLRVESAVEGKVEIKYLVHDAIFPKGFQPAFAVKDGYLLFAGSPDSIRRFAAPAVANETDETPILRISAIGWSRYLREHKNEVAAFAAKVSGTEAKNVAARIDDLLPNLAALDRFEIVVRGKENLATLTLRLKMAKRE